MHDDLMAQDKIDDLLVKLRATALDEQQRALLEAMIKMAIEVQVVTIEGMQPLPLGFEGSFTPQAAKLVLGYSIDESESDQPTVKRSNVTQYVTK